MREPPNERRGFIHKKIGGFIGGVAGALFPPVAPIIGAIGGGRAPQPRFLPQPQCQPGFQLDASGRCARVGVVGAVERIVPGGASGFVPAAGIGCPSGTHPNRSSYMTMSDGFVEKGTKCVSNRRRNPLNPRAARRSMSRLTALSKEMNRLEKTLRRIAPRR